MSPDKSLSRTQRITVLSISFLGWLLAGSIMALGPLTGRAAIASLLDTDSEATIGLWFSRYICAFLLGAAAGGISFGWLGDVIGRAKAMGIAIIWYSLFSGLTYLVTDVYQLTLVRFVACLGVGGMWPNAVALTSEVWSSVSRPFLSGLIGTSANIGFVLVSLLTAQYAVSAGHWRWIFLVALAPTVIGLYALIWLPESPSWISTRARPKSKPPAIEVLTPPLLKTTALGILLGAIPLLGNWGGANFLVPWAGKIGGLEDPALKSWTQFAKSTGAAIGAFLGGWIASFFGRRTTYFAISLISLAVSSYIFWYLTPTHSRVFFGWVAAIGFFGTIYFGWLPLYLPELFETRVRATGAGVSFNFGRILTAIAVAAVGQLMAWLGDYSQIGRVTCLVYALGMVVICFAPDTSKRKLD